MTTDTIRHKLTPTNVLNIFIEQHRLCSPLDPEADEYAELSFDSSIDYWRNANDLISWRPLSKVLNEEFFINVSEDAWKNVLTPSSKRTLRDVCELISRHSQHADITSKAIFEQECLSAAVFLTLKKYLQRHGVDVSELRPSSSVSSYLDKDFGKVIAQTTIVANGKRVLNELGLRRTKTGILNYMNIFDKTRYTLSTGDIKTFRDLTLKIIEVNTNDKSSA